MSAFFGRETMDLRSYFERNVSYRGTAVLKDIEGVVTIGFTVGRDGKTKDIILLKVVNEFAGRAVIKAIINMPLWQPALQNGRNIASYREESVYFHVEWRLPVQDKSKEMPVQDK